MVSFFYEEEKSNWSLIGIYFGVVSLVVIFCSADFIVLVFYGVEPCEVWLNIKIRLKL